MPNENEKTSNIPPQINRVEHFKYHSFLSLSKVINMFSYKEWRGETKNNEIVIISYRDGELKIGAGWNEIKAKINMELVAMTKDMLGKLVVHDNNYNIEKINNQLKLEWILPEGFIDE